MKTGITPVVTHKKSWKKFFFYWSKWFKILWEPSLGPKLRPKIFLWPNLKNSWFYQGRKKKVSKFSEKWQKMQKFLKFKCGFLAENGRYSAEKWPTKSGLPQILTKIFFITKSQKLMILSRKVETPLKNGLFWGGFRKLYTTYPRYHLSCLAFFF